MNCLHTFRLLSLAPRDVLLGSAQIPHPQGDSATAAMHEWQPAARAHQGDGCAAAVACGELQSNGASVLKHL